MATSDTGDAPQEPSPLQQDEFYFDGPLLVFTEAYHLRRGFCCGSGCRHCPWRARMASGEASSG